ncbi:ATP-binding cassette, subfamily B [Alkalibacterium putridalgicola]|uniref:ABC transporter ATP-binding protein n=2 Tax=Alkalibacterium putridalgicola TaxID=426703 RepID=A0A1H7WFE1_9LACT|nr:ABC transporter ATP-binding protein [Alkalibacterium putridalgicola]SEM20211.1 ATP-binding cassette, subfamily B [Alkalibacterium putridalgicola]
MGTVDTFKRAITDLFVMGKKYYALFFLQSLARYSLPFIGFIYMTRIVAALTNDNWSLLPQYIAQYLIILLFLQLISAFLQPLVNNESSLFTRIMFAMPNKKMLSMQYQYAESSEVREQLEMINRNMQSSQSSLPIIHVRIRNIIPKIITVIWGLILLFPLFSINRGQLPEEFWWLHPALILSGFIVLLAITISIQIKTSKISSKSFAEMMGKLKHFNAMFSYEDTILEDVQSGKEIRLYDLSKKMTSTIDSESIYVRQLITANYKRFRKIYLSTASLFQTMNYMIYAYIGILVLVGTLPVAMIIQLSGALSQMVSALPDFIQQTMMIFSSPEDLKEFYAFMDLPNEEVVGSLPVEKRLDNEYEFDIRNLSFAYPGSEELVLKNISETFEVGKKYAIVGENGSGKTTFIKLLTRLYEPTTGTIKMNKIDTKKYDLREYFNLFGVVFQDYHLVGFSLGQNISVTPTYDKDRVMMTLDKVGLGEFVRNLPKQLDTYLGTEFDDSGVNVSGGQEQKLAIARSLYKDAPVMILDEPTAALDPLTEFEIYQNFDNLVEDKTAFYISHRLSSSKFCDEILVFDKGEIIQRGTHQDLVKEEGKYQELWSAQAQYYQ